MNCAHARLRATEGLEFAYDPVETYRASSATCPHCDLLLKAVQAYKPGWMDQIGGENRHEIWLDRDVKGPHVVSLNEITADNDRIDAGSFCYLRKPKDDPIYNDSWQDRDKVYGGWWPDRDELYESLEITGDSSSAMAFERVSKWLSHCVENHDDCRVPNPRYMPRRLLNVGSDGGCDPFLFEPKTPVLYVCLSYCWGKDTSTLLKTLKKNLKDHYKCIRMSELPKTIQDAVRLCRGLKLENLWIDSLCIVQDDSESWLQDSAQMHQIYANSHLTITGLEPAYCKGGLLGEQRFGKPEWQRRVITDVAVEAGGPGKEILLRPRVIPEERRGRSSLDSRGWCLQESILPNRRVCFDGNEMSWECVSVKFCECGHLRWHDFKLRMPILTAQGYGKLGRLIKKPSPAKNWNSSETSWMALVEDYTRRSLTQETDKLVAISGLAKLILHVPQETDSVPSKIIVQGAPDSASKVGGYVAGLWRNTFVSELAWSIEEPEKSGLASYVAPSWSWASFNGPVVYKFRESLEDWKKHPKLKEYCTLDDAVFEAALSSDPSGAVNAAHAILTGPLALVELVSFDVSFVRDWDVEQKYSRQPPYEAKKSFVRAKNLVSVEVCLDRNHSCLGKDDAQADCWIQGRCERQCCAWESERSDIEAKPLFCCLRLFSWAHSDTGIATPELWFLVLRRSQVVEEAYERVGLGMWRAGYDAEDPEYCPLFDGAKLSTIKVV